MNIEIEITKSKIFFSKMQELDTGRYWYVVPELNMFFVDNLENNE